MKCMSKRFIKLLLLLFFKMKRLGVNRDICFSNTQISVIYVTIGNIL